MFFLGILIRTKLADGRLPLKRPAIVPGGPGQGGSCDACDKPLMAGQLTMEIQTYSGWPVYLHADCFLLWDDVRRRVLIESS